MCRLLSIVYLFYLFSNVNAQIYIYKTTDTTEKRPYQEIAFVGNSLYGYVNEKMPDESATISYWEQYANGYEDGYGLVIEKPYIGAKSADLSNSRETYYIFNYKDRKVFHRFTNGYKTMVYWNSKDNIKRTYTLVRTINYKVNIGGSSSISHVVNDYQPNPGGNYYGGTTYPTNPQNGSQGSVPRTPSKRWKNVTRTYDCNFCHRSGKCNSCNGKGWYQGTYGPIDCPNCDGYKTGRCSKCHGSGTIEKIEQVFE